MKTNTAGADQLSPVVAVSARSAKRQGLRWFVRAPARMALDSGLSAVAFRLATVLLHYEGELGCFPSQERLSTDLGISVDSVQRYLRELELYGFLIVEKRGRRNNYRLEPIYEAPIGHGSIEETGQLEVENLPKRRPPQPRSLRTRTLVETAKDSAPEHAAPVRSIAHGISGAQLAAPVRSIGAVDPSQRTAPVRSEHTAPLRSEAVKTPHAGGTNKNLLNIKNQHQQETAASVVGDVLQENDGLAEAIAALQRVGVNIVAIDLGVHAGRGRQLLHDELIQWSMWVRSHERNGISNKVAFAASKIRLGFTVSDIFPRPVDRAPREVGKNSASTNDSEARKLAEEIDRERSQRADTVIASLDDTGRQDLRARALSDPAAWIGRNVSPATFDRLVCAVERRLVLADMSVAKT